MTQPVVIILAAGKGERFLASGATTHKLDALLSGTPVLMHVINAVKASGLPWHLVRPPGGTAGMGASVALGVRATPDAPGWLILPGDLPLIQPATLDRDGVTPLPSGCAFLSAATRAPGGVQPPLLLCPCRTGRRGRRTGDCA